MQQNDIKENDHCTHLEVLECAMKGNTQVKINVCFKVSAKNKKMRLRKCKRQKTSLSSTHTP